MTDTQPQNTDQQPNGPHEPENHDPETFDADYVKGLRDEAATNRVKAKEEGERATALLTALREAAIREHSRGILADPSDLAWSDEFGTEDGMPDADKITAAAEALADAKPHLARVRGDAGQGYRGEQSGTVDLAGMLRVGA